MFAAVDWDNLVPAAAFVLGAILATIATIRVVRAVTIMLGGQIHRRPGRRTTPGDPGPTGMDDQSPGD